MGDCDEETEAPAVSRRGRLAARPGSTSALIEGEADLSDAGLHSICQRMG